MHEGPILDEIYKQMSFCSKKCSRRNRISTPILESGNGNRVNISTAKA
jgi:hypothetical protein